MNISKITIDRLYNKGNYEHVKYSLTVDIKEGESAKAAFIGASRLLAALNPKEPVGQCAYDNALAWQKLSIEEKGKECLRSGYCEKVVEKIEAKDKQSAEIIELRTKWMAKREKALALFDAIGGASEHNDAKYTWDFDDYDYDEH